MYIDRTKATEQNCHAIKVERYMKRLLVRKKWMMGDRKKWQAGRTEAESATGHHPTDLPKHNASIDIYQIQHK